MYRITLIAELDENNEYVKEFLEEEGPTSDTRYGSIEEAGEDDPMWLGQLIFLDGVDARIEAKVERIS